MISMVTGMSNHHSFVGEPPGLAPGAGATGRLAGAATFGSPSVAINRKLIPFDNDATVFGRKLAEGVKKQTTDGFHRARIEVRVHQSVEMLDGHRAVDTVCALSDLLHAQRPLTQQLRAAHDLSKYALQQILHGDQAGHAAVLVDGERQGQLPFTKGVK
jgi:hypothetical protein